MRRTKVAKLCALGLALVAAVSTYVAVAPPAQADSAALEQMPPLKIQNVVYLIHASLYEGLEKKGALAAGNYEIYREREKLCQQRWRQRINALGANDLFVQLYGDQSILAYARQKLGERRVIAPSAKWEAGLAANVYHDRLADSFRRQLADKQLELDLGTVPWELAGESFEGCVYTYGGGMASSLGMDQPAVINFDLTVPDARFLCGATLVETFTVAGSDVNAYVFDGPEGYYIGAFLPGLRDHRTPHITLPLADVSKVSVVNKIGNTLFSRKSSTRGCIGPDRDHPGISVVDQGLQVDVGPSWYVLGRATSRAEFLTAMRGAAAGTAE